MSNYIVKGNLIGIVKRLKNLDANKAKVFDNGAKNIINNIIDKASKTNALSIANFLMGKKSLEALPEYIRRELEKIPQLKLILKESDSLFSNGSYIKSDLAKVIKHDILKTGEYFGSLTVSKNKYNEYSKVFDKLVAFKEYSYGSNNITNIIADATFKFNDSVATLPPLHNNYFSSSAVIGKPLSSIKEVKQNVALAYKDLDVNIDMVTYEPEEFEVSKHMHKKNKENDTYVFFHGTNDNEKKAKKGTPLTLSRLNKHLNDENYSSRIIDGPNVIGQGFTENVILGFESLLRSFANNANKGIMNQSIVLTGHSRGGCEAIGVNNLFCDLINSEFNIKVLSLDVTKHLSLGVINLIKELEYNQLDVSKVEIHLNLLDPVLGPDNFITHQEAYSLTHKLSSLVNSKNHKVVLMSVMYEERGFMDIHIPKKVAANMEPIIRVKTPTSHGGIVRFNKGDETDHNKVIAYDNISALVGFESSNKVLSDVNFKRPTKYATGSERRRLSLLNANKFIKPDGTKPHSNVDLRLNGFEEINF